MSVLCEGQQGYREERSERPKHDQGWTFSAEAQSCQVLLKAKKKKEKEKRGHSHSFSFDTERG